MSRKIPKKIRNTQKLIEAATAGHAGDVKLLIPVSFPETENNKALCMAARNGHLECVRLLFPVSAPHEKFAAAMTTAIYHEHIDVVQELLGGDEPKEITPMMMFRASTNPQILALLIPHCGKKMVMPAHINALQNAATSRHTECVKMLIPVSEADKVLEDLKEYYPRHAEFLMQCMAELEQQTLHNECTAAVRTPIRTRKM